jgi:hypothetical protein
MSAHDRKPTNASLYGNVKSYECHCRLGYERFEGMLRVQRPSQVHILQDLTFRLSTFVYAAMSSNMVSVTAVVLAISRVSWWLLFGSSPDAVVAISLRRRLDRY